VSAAPSQPRRRDAARTRQLLLDRARVRFIRDGYAATTVRDIADDAGVNVALINRYFTSKEGLFEACLDTAATSISKEVGELTPEELAGRIVRRILGKAEHGGLQDSYLMLLRTTGDERIDAMRRAILTAASRKLTAAWGPHPDEATLLRAQVVLAAAIGIALLKTSVGLAPLASADEQALTGPVTDLINAVLPH
jgi:AcrR family transcriptional regulator